MVDASGFIETPKLSRSSVFCGSCEGDKVTLTYKQFMKLTYWSSGDRDVVSNFEILLHACQAGLPIVLQESHVRPARR